MKNKMLNFRKLSRLLQGNGSEVTVSKIIREGQIRISRDSGVEWSGFKFGGRPSEEEKALEMADWGIQYLQAIKQNILDHGLPPGYNPHQQGPSEVAEFGAYYARRSKVKATPPTGQSGE